MKTNQLLSLLTVTACIATALSTSGATQAAPTPDQMVASLKQNLADSQKRLRAYEWIETTSISLKGDEKSRKRQAAYYGADGKLTKLPLDAPPAQAQAAPARGGRLKKRIVEKKKDEMQEYMERAATLIHQYVPPSPALVQKAKDSGNMLLRPPTQGAMRVEFKEFVQPSDLMTIDVDAAALLLKAINVATYLDKPEDAVTLDVRFATLADGTSYTAQTTLDAKAKNIRVVIANAGHRPLTR
jgi:hypothetical protein